MKITSGDLRSIIRSEAEKAPVINEQQGLSLSDALADVMSRLAREMYDQKGSRYEKADKTMKRLANDKLLELGWEIIRIGKKK